MIGGKETCRFKCQCDSTRCTWMFTNTYTHMHTSLLCGCEQNSKDLFTKHKYTHYQMIVCLQTYTHMYDHVTCTILLTTALMLLPSKVLCRLAISCKMQPKAHISLLMLYGFPSHCQTTCTSECVYHKGNLLFLTISLF